MTLIQWLHEENETRIAELKRDAYEFRRDVVSNPEAINKTGRLKSEAVFNFLETKIESKVWEELFKLKFNSGSLSLFKQ